MADIDLADECIWCRRDEPCDCGDTPCKCSCGQCLAPWVHADGTVEVHPGAIREKLRAQRDQAEQQRDELLAAIAEHRAQPAPILASNSPVLQALLRGDKLLYEAAARISNDIEGE